MNAYKISYRSPGMDEMMTATVTAPDNRVAERSFKAGFKGSGLPAPDIFHIELVSTNATATKDQEREALEKIKAIVEALGPDSYIGTALEGCFEIAEWNIENDFACSMKRRAEAAERKAEELEKKVSALELDNRDLRLAIKKEKEEASATETALRERVVSDDDLTDCIQMARDSAYGYREKMEEAAASVVELADDPSSPEFTKAVKDHRNAKTAYEYAEALASRLEKIRDNMTAGEQ